MNLVRDQKLRNSAYISTLTNQTPELGGPEFRGLESSGVLWRFFCVAHLSSHSFATKGIIKQVPRAGCVGIPCVTERTREKRGRRNTGTDIIQWHNRGPLNPRPPPHNLITPLPPPHPTLLPITRRIPIPVLCRMHCLRRNCSSVRCATRDLNKVGFLFFFSLFVSFRLVQVLLHI